MSIDIDDIEEQKIEYKLYKCELFSINPLILKFIDDDIFDKRFLRMEMEIGDKHSNAFIIKCYQNEIASDSQT